MSNKGNICLHLCFYPLYLGPGSQHREFLPHHRTVPRGHLHCPGLCCHQRNTEWCGQDWSYHRWALTTGLKNNSGALKCVLFLTKWAWSRIRSITSEVEWGWVRHVAFKCVRGLGQMQMWPIKRLIWWEGQVWPAVLGDLVRFSVDQMTTFEVICKNTPDYAWKHYVKLVDV